ncbi:MAG: GNAT family acetyltransferase [Lachnospiraceae bacterium]|nr:GNAT family acetyltransferase [Lachnospiraceae bacterium]
MGFSVINILDLIDNTSENEVDDFVSKFKCEKNNEIEEFIHKDAIDFAKRKISVTHLVLDNEANMLGYFTLTHKPIRVPADLLTNTTKKKIERFTKLDEATNTYDVSAFLIAQFGKNTSLPQAITGNEMMNMALSVLSKVQREIGGGIVFLECEDNDKLLEFYENENNRFIIYGNRYSNKENIMYKQLLRLF